jgi:hypothetical protein
VFEVENFLVDALDLSRVDDPAICVTAGLRQIQFFGSGGEVAVCDHFNECPELIQIDAPHGNKYLLLLS